MLGQDPGKLRGRRTDFIDFCREHHNLFPALFTICCAAVFGPVSITGVILAMDMCAKYWVGWIAWFVVAIPVLIFGCHFVHLNAGKPLLFPVLLSTLVPSAILVSVGWVYMRSMENVSEMLWDRDCNVYPEIARIETAHHVAEELLEACVGRVVLRGNMSYEEAHSELDLRDCWEYRHYFDSGGQYLVFGNWKREWAYLEALEGARECAGWCGPSRPLWGPLEVGLDTCKTAAAVHAETMTAPKARELLLVGVACAGVSALAVAAIQEALDCDKDRKGVTAQNSW